ncbi:MAG: GAF domain-containing protein [Methanotrichaceae archaeon]|nr:GAF domain-containing protein [Methanotrichaceae archaeon]
MGDEKAACSDSEMKIKQMLRKITEMQESGSNAAHMPALLDGLKKNLDELLACLSERCTSSAGREAFGRMNSPFEDFLFLQDRDLRYTWFSCEKPFGVEASMALGRTESHFFPPTDARRLRRIKEQVLETGNRAQTKVHLTLQGRERCFDCIYYLWRDESGKTLGLAGYVRDATVQKDAEIEILKMTKAVETSPTAIVLTDLEGRIEYVNPSLLKDSGFQDVSQAKGRFIFDFTNAEGKAKLQEEIIPSLHSIGQWQGELALTKLDGQSYMVEMICALVKDECGKPIYLLANFYNITDRKRAEEALLLDDSRLEALQRLNQMDEASIKEIADFALEAGVKLTGSKLGYLAFVDEDEKTLFMHSWSKKAMAECDIEHKRIVYHLQETGLWGEAIRQRNAVITNDYASATSKRGTPEGHAKIVRHMNVPIMDKGKIVIVAGLGNKGAEYNDSDVRQLTLLMSGMWKIIQRREAEEELHRRDLLLQGVAKATNYLLTSDPQAVKRALGILGEAADVDRVRILANRELLSEEQQEGLPLQWFRVHAGQFSKDLSWEELFLGWQDRLSRSNPIQGITSQLSVPGAKMLEELDIRSFLLLPIFIESRFYAVMCFEDCQKERRWNDNDIAVLQAAAGSIGEAILRRRMEGALRESQRALSMLMSNLPGMAYRCKNDPLWAMEFVSDGCLALTGYQSEEMLHNKAISYANLIYPDDRDYVWNEIQEAIAEKRPFRLIYRIRSRSGIKWVWEQGQGIFLPDGDLIALEGFINDITERKLAEEALERTQEELEKRVAERTSWLLRANAALQEEMVKHKKTEMELRLAQQAADAALRAKSEFLANMSHEIRTPMNAVIGLAGLLLETDLTEEQRDFGETIHSSGDALLAIINDILDFSKIDEGKMKLERLPFALRDCIESSLDMVAAKAAEKGLHLTYAIDEKVAPTILGDSVRLRQVLANLLSNAVKFTDKGRIAIHVQPGEKADKIHFSVSDTGIGISSEDNRKLFLSFSQVDASTSRKYGGTGLGLAISKRLVELMGGSIWVESVLGKGSTFHFQIFAEPFSGEAIKLHLAGKKIMALLGSEATLRELVDYARSWGMQIYPVISAFEARELAESRFDVVILDLDVPGAEELAEEIEENLPIITLTSSGRQRAGKKSLIKPLSEASIRFALQEAIMPQNHKKMRAGSSEAVPLDLEILLAEDNPVNQKVARLMLKKLGYKADLVSNGREVLQAISKKPYDVILMDVQMPEMDGLEATRAILDLKLKNRPKILAMTAYALEGDKERCLLAGMDGYISKPVQLEELRNALQSLQNAPISG